MANLVPQIWCFIIKVFRLIIPEGRLKCFFIVIIIGKVGRKFSGKVKIGLVFPCTISQ